MKSIKRQYIVKKIPNKKGLSTASKATKALMLVNKLKNQTELKYSAYAQTQNSNWSGAQFSFLNNIGQGTSANNRIGDSIRVKHIDLRFQFRPANTGALKFPVRIVIWRDYEGVTTVTPSLMFEGGVGTTLAAIKLYDPNYKHDYKVLYDRTFTPSGNNEFPAYKARIKVDATSKFVGSSVSEPIKNSLRGIILSGANPATAADLTAVDLEWMVHYTDN